LNTDTASTADVPPPERQSILYDLQSVVLHRYEFYGLGLRFRVLYDLQSVVLHR